MTDTAREAAIERVRAYVAEFGDDLDFRNSGRLTSTPLLLGDLRLLLSGREGGRHLAKDALPRGETHPDTPSQPSALREASCSFCGRREGEVVALMFGPRVDLAICDQCAQVAACEGDGQKSAALTDPRQPSERWRPIESAPRDGTLFLAWQIIPTEDGDTGRVTDEPSPCIAQSVFGSVGSIPLHYVPQGQRFTHWMPLPPAPPSGEGGGL